MDASLIVVISVMAFSCVISKRGSMTNFYGLFAVQGWLQVIADSTTWHSPGALVITVPLSMLFTWLWWNSQRPKRQKVREWIGAKSRALREALVRRLAERKIRGIVPVPA